MNRDALEGEEAALVTHFIEESTCFVGVYKSLAVYFDDACHRFRQ